MAIVRAIAKVLVVVLLAVLLVIQVVSSGTIWVWLQNIWHTVLWPGYDWATLTGEQQLALVALAVAGILSVLGLVGTARKGELGIVGPFLAFFLILLSSASLLQVIRHEMWKSHAPTSARAPLPVESSSAPTPSHGASSPSSSATPHTTKTYNIHAGDWGDAEQFAFRIRNQRVVAHFWPAGKESIWYDNPVCFDGSPPQVTVEMVPFGGTRSPKAAVFQQDLRISGRRYEVMYREAGEAPFYYVQATQLSLEYKGLNQIILRKGGGFRVSRYPLKLVMECSG